MRTAPKFNDDTERRSDIKLKSIWFQFSSRRFKWNFNRVFTLLYKQDIGRYILVETKKKGEKNLKIFVKRMVC